jgi:nitroreductase
MTLPPDTIGLLEGMTTTRAIRRFRPDPIPEEDLATILFAATRAPSGSNRQPFRFLVLRDGPKARAAKALIRTSAARVWGTKRTDENYDGATAARADSPKARLDAAVQYLIDHFEEVPVVVLACLVRYRQPTPTEGGSIYPACQNLLLAARALGYGGVLTGYHHHVEAELRDLLGIPDGVALCATIPMGRPLGHHGPLRRRPMQQLVFEETWEAPPPWAVDPPDTRFVMGLPPTHRWVTEQGKPS